MISSKGRIVKNPKEFPRKIKYGLKKSGSIFNPADHIFKEGAYLPNTCSGYIIFYPGREDSLAVCELFWMKNGAFAISPYQLTGPAKNWDELRNYLVPGNQILFAGRYATKREERKMKRKVVHSKKTR
jgi:hypothetical protein